MYFRLLQRGLPRRRYCSLRSAGKSYCSWRLAERLGETLQGRHDLAGQEYLVYGISRTGDAGATPRPTPHDGELRRIA
jgi:hypothetical protein